MWASGSAGNGDIVDLLSLGILPALVLSVYIVFKEAKPYPSTYKWGFAVTLGAAALLAWIIPAVGIYGQSGDPADLPFYGVLAVGITGALVSRFRPRGMAYTLAGMAIAQVLVSLSGILAGLGAVPILNGFFTTLWIFSAWLFWHAGQASLTNHYH